MKTRKGNGVCKTCGKPIEQDELRCELHEKQFQAWVDVREHRVPRTESAYTPRFNGIHGIERNEEYMRRKRIAFALMPGLRPGQPLKFE